MNHIGRLSHSTPSDINIAINTEDKFMSRHHCDILIKWSRSSNSYEYILTDRNSANGTFINEGKRLYRSEEVELKDGDNIQLGRTKIILKTAASASSSDDAELSVRESSYFKTIIE